MASRAIVFEGTCDTEVNRMVALETVNWTRTYFFQDGEGITVLFHPSCLVYLAFLTYLTPYASTLSFINTYLTRVQ